MRRMTLYARRPVRTGRLEAFSDGVMAIAITLLVLDLRVPARDQLRGESLLHALGRGWPNYFAYAITFAVIGIMWVNHHALLDRCERATRKMLMANLFLLSIVAALPFTTALFAEYVRDPGWNGHVAAAVYSATMFAAAVAFNLLARMALGRTDLSRFAVGLAVYSGATVLAFVSAPATLALHAVIAIYYAFDQLPVGESADA